MAARPGVCQARPDYYDTVSTEGTLRQCHSYSAKTKRNWEMCQLKALLFISAVIYISVHLFLFLRFVELKSLSGMKEKDMHPQSSASEHWRQESQTGSRDPEASRDFSVTWLVEPKGWAPDVSDLGYGSSLYLNSAALSCDPNGTNFWTCSTRVTCEVVKWAWGDVDISSVGLIIWLCFVWDQNHNEWITRKDSNVFQELQINDK